MMGSYSLEIKSPMAEEPQGGFMLSYKMENYAKWERVLLN